MWNLIVKKHRKMRTRNVLKWISKRLLLTVFKDIKRSINYFRLTTRYNSWNNGVNSNNWSFLISKTTYASLKLVGSRKLMPFGYIDIQTVANITLRALYRIIVYCIIQSLLALTILCFETALMNDL